MERNKPSRTSGPGIPRQDLRAAENWRRFGHRLASRSFTRLVDYRHPVSRSVVVDQCRQGTASRPVWLSSVQPIGIIQIAVRGRTARLAIPACEGVPFLEGRRTIFFRRHAGPAYDALYGRDEAPTRRHGSGCTAAKMGPQAFRACTRGTLSSDRSSHLPKKAVGLVTHR